MSDYLTAIGDQALPQGEAPDWVHLLPAGRMKARDGRVFDLADAQVLVHAFAEGGVDLPIDHEHQNDKPEARWNGPVRAAGWIKALEQRSTGL